MLFAIANSGRAKHTAGMRKSSLLAALLVSAPVASPALAASSGWTDTEGASLRLVTTGTPDAEGKLRGALEIQLQPGWKTYWRDPGGAGVPPSIDVSASRNVAGVEVDFPAPKRFDDGYAISAGYDQPVTLPLVFSVADKSQSAIIEANLFLGVCEKICVPVQATLDVDPLDDPENPNDAATVANAFMLLPAAADASFGVSSAQLGADTLTVEVVLPSGVTEGDLFVAYEAGFSLGAPKQSMVDGRLRFAVPVFDQPKPVLAGTSLAYTLVTPAGAVSGRISVP